ncbi:hypothetical protein E4U50_001107 [Claviceps purpurea]|nr:hypothetical protein E4U50_001107 [Claviceps purpurea]
MPSALTCLQCQSKVCQLCRKDAHDIGTHCPEDAELLDALETSGRDSWRRCYRCCQLVAPSDPTGPVTCACKAKFCLSCGGVWDILTGCPNLCPRERDPTLRREDKAQTPPQQGPAQRSMQHPEVQSLLQAQRNEMRRMLDFKNAALTSLEARQAAQETALTDQHIQDRDELVAKQARDASQLEDRQISDELELRNKLEQAEWSNTIRIKYMEAYCEAPSQSPSVSSSKSSTSSSSSLPPRVVTEKNLRDLGRQYSLREKVQREHESKIYMLRVRQSKKMEDLVQSHGAQLRELIERNREAREAFGERVRRERKTFDGVFGARQARLTARWALSIQVQCRELQGRDGLRYALVAPPSWMGGEASSEEAGL